MLKKIKPALKILSFIIMLLLVILASAYIPFFSVTDGEPIPKSDTIKSALLVIDIQEGLSGSLSTSPSYKCYADQSEELIKNTNKALDKAVELGIPVLYICHEDTHPVIKFVTRSYMVKGSPRTAIDKRVKIVAEPLFTKNIMDGFSNPELHNHLIKNNINKLYITGLDASFCVYRTSQAAIKRGYQVTIIEDAVIASSKEKKEKMLPKYKEKGINLKQLKDLLALQSWNK